MGVISRNQPSVQGTSLKKAQMSYASAAEGIMAAVPKQNTMTPSYASSQQAKKHMKMSMSSSFNSSVQAEAGTTSTVMSITKRQQ